MTRPTRRTKKRYLVFSPDPPEGDHPWWTLRFVNKPSKTAERRIAARLVKVLGGPLAPDDVIAWRRGGRQCRFDPGDYFGPFETEREWTRFYRDVDRAFDDIDAIEPLFAVVCQDMDDLQDLDDDALREVASPKPARASPKADARLVSIAEGLRSRNPRSAAIATKRVMELLGTPHADAIGAALKLPHAGKVRGELWIFLRGKDFWYEPTKGLDGMAKRLALFGHPNAMRAVAGEVWAFFSPRDRVENMHEHPVLEVIYQGLTSDDPVRRKAFALVQKAFASSSTPRQETLLWARLGEWKKAVETSRKKVPIDSMGEKVPRRDHLEQMLELRASCLERLGRKKEAAEAREEIVRLNAPVPFDVLVKGSGEYRTLFEARVERTAPFVDEWGGRRERCVEAWLVDERGTSLRAIFDVGHAKALKPGQRLRIEYGFIGKNQPEPYYRSTSDTKITLLGKTRTKASQTSSS